MRKVGDLAGKCGIAGKQRDELADKKLKVSLVLKRGI